MVLLWILILKTRIYRFNIYGFVHRNTIGINKLVFHVPSKSTFIFILSIVSVFLEYWIGMQDMWATSKMKWFKWSWLYTYILPSYARGYNGSFCWLSKVLINQLMSNNGKPQKSSSMVSLRTEHHEQVSAYNDYELCAKSRLNTVCNLNIKPTSC